MAVRLEEVTGKRFKELIPSAICETLDDNEMAILENAMTKSTEVWRAMDGDSLLCIAGVSPDTLMSRDAYLWMYNPPVGRQSVSALRESKRLINHFLSHYDRLVGHCKEAKSRRWLEWLGAKFQQADEPIAIFMIEAK